VSKVEFFRSDGATKLGEDTTAPYSYVWQRAPSGTHSLRVKATDNRGGVGTSAPVSIRVRGLFG
jgi:Bacterial Ig domain